jgi:hypothetical protein
VRNLGLAVVGLVMVGKARPIAFWPCRAAHGQHGYVIVSLVGAN